MICFSSVGYIMEVTHFMNLAWYRGVHEEVGKAYGLDSEQRFFEIGKLAQAGIVGNTILSIPFSIVAIFCTPSLMTWMGFAESIVNLSKTYTIVAVISELVLSTKKFLSVILYLDHNYKSLTSYKFMEALIGVLITFIVSAHFRPNLIVLQIVLLLSDIIFELGFFHFAFKKVDWYHSFISGLTPVTCLSPQEKEATRLDEKKQTDSSFQNVKQILNCSTLAFVWEDLIRIFEVSVRMKYLEKILNKIIFTNNSCK